MHRRALFSSLGTAIPATLAGCAGFGTPGGRSAVGRLPTATLELTAVTDADLPARVLYTVGPDEVSNRQMQLMERVLDGGDTVEATRPPLPARRDVLFDGTVYRLAHEVVETTPATWYQVKVDVVTGTVSDSERIRFGDLPAVDRAAFARHGLADGKTVGVGTTFLYTAAQREQSALVPRSNYSVVVWPDGSRAEWVVDGATDTTLNAYHYTAERVASAAEYGRRMRERFAFALSNLSDAQRHVVETAISEGRYVVHRDATPSAAFTSLVERFRGREQVHALDTAGEGDLNGRYLVRYADGCYLATLGVYGDAFRTATSASTTTTGGS